MLRFKAYDVSIKLGCVTAKEIGVKA